MPCQDSIYLTFDDGPEEKSTSWLLDLLKEDIKATFCMGRQIESHPELFREILNHGHAIGNHTYNHEKAVKQTMKNTSIPLKKQMS